MPAGVSWGRYISFSVAAMLSMVAGSQLVHQHYRPLQNLNEYIERELKNLPEQVKLKIREELEAEGIIR